MNTNFDRRKSLQELERDDWEEPGYDSNLVQTCHRLRRVPLMDFTTEDLRIMIGQQISLPFLLPLAIEQLEVNPLAEGDFYPGDLLASVLKIDTQIFEHDAELRERVRQIVKQIRSALSSLDDFDRRTISEILEAAPPDGMGGTP